MIEVNTAVNSAISRLKRYGDDVDSGHWQGVPTEGKPDLVTRELLNLQFSANIPSTQVAAAHATDANMPWAEDHFQERVSRVPSNPGEQYLHWPWWQGQVDFVAAQSAKLVSYPADFKFDHTYQERFWPIQAGQPHPAESVNLGIRYRYGDLDDVLKLLHNHPKTRQATFPIFFPEDTGAVHGGRVPCTLHYHFLRRNDRLHLWYPMRSCDAVRHFRDDVYMACRLVQWVLDELRLTSIDRWHGVTPGVLHFTAYSFHVHKGDIHLL